MGVGCRLSGGYARAGTGGQSAELHCVAQSGATNGISMGISKEGGTC